MSPKLVSHAAMQTYVGARYLSAESMVSQPIFAKNCILAGCPIAPALAKVIMGPMVTTFVDKIKPWVTDVWVDDVSVDLAAASSRELARLVLRAFRILREIFAEHGFELSPTKTAFLVSQNETARLIRQQSEYMML